MKALAIQQRPDPGQLDQVMQMLELPIPEPGAREVCVRMLASTINIDDLHMAEGTMFGGVPVTPKPRDEKPWIPGTDVAGVVHSLGKDVTAFEVGQRVYGMRSPKYSGPWAEYGISKASFLSPMPEGYSAVHAAALPISAVVVCAIFAALGEVKGKRCLVVGASGGIGTLMVRSLVAAGAEVWGVCSGKNSSKVASLGATRIIDYQVGSFGEQLAHSGDKVDALIDLVGGIKTQRDGLAVTRSTGRFVTVVGPEKQVGERMLGVFGLTRMVLRIGWSWLRSFYCGPRYFFVGPLAPDFKAVSGTFWPPGSNPLSTELSGFRSTKWRQRSVISEATALPARW
jgi:alcohol dehydrogenase